MSIIAERIRIEGDLSMSEIADIFGWEQAEIASFNAVNQGVIVDPITEKVATRLVTGECTVCGTGNPHDEEFCHICGNDLRYPEGYRLEGGYFLPPVESKKPNWILGHCTQCDSVNVHGDDFCPVCNAERGRPNYSIKK